jgi:hypothetical protein
MAALLACRPSAVSRELPAHAHAHKQQQDMKLRVGFQKATCTYAQAAAAGHSVMCLRV